MSKATIQIISDWLNGKGIMSVLTDNFPVPWANVIDGQVLDDDYYGNRSGNKVCSPLVQKFITPTGISDANMERLARVIYAKYGESWQKAFEALYAEYDPIKNYDMVEEESPAKTKETITPAETTTTVTPAETTETETPVEYTDTKTPAETTETETREDLNVNEANAGIKTEQTKSFPTARTTTTTEQGQKTDVLEFNNRKDTLSKSGSIENARDYGDGYITEGKEWSKEYKQERINAFNGGLTIANDSETLSGVGNGPSGAGGSPSGPDGSSNNGTYKKETGGYSDTESYTNYKEENEKDGTETRTYTTGNGQNPYTTTTTEAGSEKNDESVKDYTKWQTERKYTTDDNEVFKHEVNTAGTNKLSVDTAGTNKVEIDNPETREFEALTKRKLTRSGNIGVTTSQQMIESEVMLRVQYTLMDTIVFPNVDAVMCLNIFGCEDKDLDDFTIITDYVLPTATASRLGGVKIGSGIMVGSDGTISISGDYITTEQLQQALQHYVTSNQLNLLLQDYATMTDLSNGLGLKQNTLISGVNIKTINGISLLGDGDIVIEGKTSQIAMEMGNSINNGTATTRISMEVQS